MGGLREKAKAELAERDRGRQEREEKALQYKQERRREEARAAAEFLSGWSGERVEPDDLEPADGFFPGFGAYKTWAICLDGFDLLVKQEKRQRHMLEEHTPEFAFQVHQRIDLSNSNPVSTPADLLARIDPEMGGSVA